MLRRNPYINYQSPLEIGKGKQCGQGDCSAGDRQLSPGMVRAHPETHDSHRHTRQRHVHTFSIFKTGSHYAEQAGLRLIEICLPLPPSATVNCVCHSPQLAMNFSFGMISCRLFHFPKLILLLRFRPLEILFLTPGNGASG